jgi:L,D-peptidoglycan transpeptidase YkuD (ErfK/YbiS/YcfS/YnhG family)
MHVIEVGGDGYLSFLGQRYRCTLGRGGIVVDKREGDGATPAGVFPLRRLLYRPDRLAPPECALTAAPLRPDDGWCDAPADPAYNRQVRLPYPSSAEKLWRQDHLYDLIVVLGFNDDPAIPGRGSAIFLHVARPDWGTTEGCLALAPTDLVAVLSGVAPTTRLRVAAPAQSAAG